MLTALYALQKVDLELDNIAELKGDLPGIVATLQSQVNDVSTRLNELEELMKTLRAQRENADLEIVTSTEKIARYKTQQLEVKSNKQYDALAREIDGAESAIAILQKEMESAEGKITVAAADAEALRQRLAELNIELTERNAELTEVNKEHEEEEGRLLETRKKIAAGISRSEIERYERIKKAKGGTAIVPVKRGSCGGCYNRIPPQKLLELHQNSRMYMCENCGRIIVSDEVVSRSAAAV